MIGQNFGPYRVVSVLGQGAMGQVFGVTDEDNRQLALKVILKDAVAEDPELEVVLRFQREVAIALELVHPRVVRTVAGGEHEGDLYLVCELVRGGSLAELLEYRGELSQDQTLSLARDILEGLSAVHAAGLIHRDMKPGNILLDLAGRAKIADLGLARSTRPDRTALTQSGSPVGTPLYMSPEQIRGEEDLDIRCDLYAVGNLLYECLTGAAPFRGRTVVATLRRHLADKVPKFPHRIKVHPTFQEVLHKLMAKTREKRFSSPEEALELLRPLVPESVVMPPLPVPNDELPRTVAMSNPLVAPELEIQIEDTITVPVATRDAETALISSDLKEESSLSGTSTDFELETAPPSVMSQLLQVASSSRVGELFPDRLRLTIKCPDGDRVLFVYGGRALRFGRNSIDRSGQDVCLRLRPSKGNEDKIRRISGQHFDLRYEGHKPFLHDLGSRGGTLVDGKALSASVPFLLRPMTEVSVAGVMRLTMHQLGPPDPPRPRIGEREVDGEVPSIYIERTSNGREHSYLLLPGRVRLGLGIAQNLVPAFKGALELFWLPTPGDGPGELWYRGADLPPGSCDRVRPGQPIGVDGTIIHVDEIRPRDQK